MDEHTRHANPDWESMTPAQVVGAVIYELYTPVSALGSYLNRLTAEDDPMSEEEYELLFEQMQEAVNQLSKTVVQLKHYARDHLDESPPA
jgi:tRNA C32,U32 (ribose-2'-O)-methylase TrmJ